MSDRSATPSPPRSRSSSRADTSTKTKAQEALERMQQSRKSVLQSTSGGGGDNERRRELLKLRQQAREQANNNEDDNVRASGGSQRPRSPIRQARRQPGVDNNDGTSNQPSSKPEDFIDDYADLTTLDQPKHVFPLSILPVSRTTEITTQPLLVIPAPHPSNIITCINYRPSCTTNSRASELQILNGDIVSNGGNDNSELGKLLDKEESKMLINNSLYYGDVSADDGLYTGQLPSMSNVLLSSETLSHEISNVVTSSVNLSRVTQRTLREFQSFIEESKVRQAISSDDYQREAHETIEARHSYAHLLQKLNSTPIFRMIEDPYIDHISQPVIPMEDIKYGGGLGNWHVTISDKQRLGNIVLSSEHMSSNNMRSILRIHLHQLVVNDHPLINEEERLYFNLKRIYQQYSAIFENRTTGYLTYRLFALITETTRLSKRTDLNEEELSHLSTLYQDLIETLPALCDLRSAIDKLSTSLAQGWKQLTEIRQRQGFASTKATLISRRISSAKDKGDEDTDYKEISHLVVEEEDWDVLSAELETVPALVKRIQKRLNNINENDETRDEEKENRRRLRRSADVDPDPAIGSSEDAIKARQAEILSDNIVNKIQTYVTDLLRMRGLLPEFVMRLSDNGSPTPDAQVDAQEFRRRMALRDLKFKAVINVNGKVVTSTELYSINHPSLTVDFRQTFELRIFNEPRDISLDIYCSSKHTLIRYEKFVANILVPFPGQVSNIGKHRKPATHTLAPIHGWLAFSSQNLFQSNNKEESMHGAIFCVTEYDVSVSDHQHKFDGVSHDDIALLPSSDASFSYSKHTDFARERDFQLLLPEIANVDINDPESDQILFQKSKAPVLKHADVFNLYGYEYSVPYAETGVSYLNFIKFQESLRIKLLKLREQKPFLFTEPIPLSEKDISSSELYNNLLTDGVRPVNELSLSPRPGDTSSKGEDNGVQITMLESKKKISNFLDRVRSSKAVVARRGKKVEHSTHSLVAETAYFQPIIIDDLDLLIPKRKRNLRPDVKARVPQALQVQSCDLLIQVIGAKCIPTRLDTLEDTNAAKLNKQGSPSKKSTKLEGIDEPAINEDMLDMDKRNDKKKARTFVEIRFQENVIATVSIEGTGPLWKQSLSLPFRAPQDDFTPSNLSQVQDVIYFTLFDQIIEDDSVGRRGYLEGENTTRTDKKFLGSFQVPFNTVYTEGKIEGIFRLSTPVFNFGYETAPIKISSNADSIFDTVNNPQDAVGSAPDTNSYIGWLMNLFPKHQRPLTLSEKDIKDYSQSLIHSKTMEEFGFFATTQTTSFIKLMITFDPLLVPPVNLNPAVETSTLTVQDRVYGPYAKVWLKDLSHYASYTKTRKYRVFAPNSAGQYTFISRYLCPHKPPKGFESRRGCSHLVSIIPFMKESTAFGAGGAVEIWCTIKEMMDMGAGDEEEHATLLYCYYYYLSRTDSYRNDNSVKTRSVNNDYNPAYPGDDVIRNESVFLALGDAIPEGSAVYVIIKDNNRTTDYNANGYLVIDPCSGYTYSAADPRCPLQKINVLATPYNLWANIQVDNVPFKMKYNVLDNNCWRPFFGARLPPPVGGLIAIQDEVSYVETSNAYAVEIEQAVRAAIKNSMRRWRSKRVRSTTTFHPDASAIVQDMLPRLETWKRASDVEADANLNRRGRQDIDDAAAKATTLDEFQQAIRDKMNKVLRTRTLSGYPLNYSFKDVEDILEKIKTLSIHEANHAEVQFVMGVRAFPAYNNVLSVWIFIGTLEPDKRKL